MKQKVKIIFTLICLLTSFTAHASSDEIVLKISGKISPPCATATEYSIASLKKIPSRVIVTGTPWHNGKVHFRGVLLRDLLKRVSAKGKFAKIIALNDYSFTIPLSDFEKYDTILAYEIDGKGLPAREKGPLWVMYPIDDFEELKTIGQQSKYVWQVKEILIQ